MRCIIAIHCTSRRFIARRVCVQCNATKRETPSPPAAGPCAVRPDDHLELWRPGNWKAVRSFHWPDLARHLVEVDQCPVHDALAGADLHRRHLDARAVAAFRHRLNRREVLLVIVAVTEEEQVLESCPLLQAEGVPAEDLAAD